MSAWIVSKRHIDALVTGLLAAEGIDTEPATPDEIGHTLWLENHRSIWARYGKQEAPVFPAYRYERNEVGAATLVKACDCYEYQSCEHDGWESSATKTLIDALRESISDNLPAFRQCKAYKDAPWGIE